jgi:hypothetical protein
LRSALVARASRRQSSVLQRRRSTWCTGRDCLTSWTEGNGRASAWWWAPPGAGKTALLVADTSPKAGTAITAYASALIILLVIGLF